jgi:hypothetical protein
MIDIRQPRILAGAGRTRGAFTARATIAVLVTDSLQRAKDSAKAWRKARVAGDLVQVRRFTRRVRAGGAAVELQLVVVSLRRRKPASDVQ